MLIYKDNDSVALKLYTYTKQYIKTRRETKRIKIKTAKNNNYSE